MRQYFFRSQTKTAVVIVDGHYCPSDKLHLFYDKTDAAIQTLNATYADICNLSSLTEHRRQSNYHQWNNQTDAEEIDVCEIDEL